MLQSSLVSMQTSLKLGAKYRWLRTTIIHFLKNIQAFKFANQHKDNELRPRTKLVKLFSMEIPLKAIEFMRS